MLYRKLLRPLMFRLPPETAHEIGLHALAWGPAWVQRRAAGIYSGPEWNLAPRSGLNFTNPIGLAAGFDKNGIAVKGLAALGFGFVEVGTVTHLPQPGNDQPRLFRLPADRALLNRLGFNNEGTEALAARLRGVPRPAGCIIGVNIGKSRAVAVEDAIPDYLASFAAVRDVAGYVAVNVSSPNTPNLRELQEPAALAALLQALVASRDAGTQKRPPLLVKIAPDLDDTQLETLVETVVNAGVDGLIATNTTISRQGLHTPPARVAALGAGGLSGAPLLAASTRLLARLYTLTKGRLPLIGVGGIFTAADAWAKICAGASLVQVYTGFVYQGPRLALEIQEGLAQIMMQKGFKTLDEAIGSAAEVSAKD